MRAVRLIAPLALIAALVAAPAARADGDPASDVLLTQRTYLPYKPKISQSRAQQLAKATAAAEARKEPVRVALIQSPTDLGAVPDFFGRPDEYAKFLSKELELGYHGGLVVVMPAGVGTAKLSAKAAGSLGGLAVGSGATPDDLAKTGVFAVQRIAKADGKPIPVVIAEDVAPGVNWGRAVVALLLAALAAAVIVMVTHRVRTRAARPAPA